MDLDAIIDYLQGHATARHVHVDQLDEAAPAARLRPLARPDVRQLTKKTRQLHLSERRRIGAAESALLLEPLLVEIFAFIGADDVSRTAAGAGGAWASRLREAHRQGCRCMAVCRAWRSAATQASAFFGRLLVPLHLCAPDSICREHGPRTKWATLDGAVSIKNKVETPTIDAAALWRSLRSLPFLERLELTRVTFTPTSHSPLSILDFTRVKELCLYKVAGLGADVLSELIACCPCLEALETHHANPWMDLYRRETALRDPRKALAGLSTWQDTDDSVAAWLLGAAQTAPRCLSTLRLGDGVDDAALKAVPHFTHLRCLNVMRTYAVSDLLRLLPRMLQAPLVALSLHVDGPAQNADAVARVLASTPAAASLKVLALSDHAQTERSTFTDRGLEACASFPQLGRLLVDDAGALTVRGVAQFLREAPALRQLGLRNCFGENFRGAPELREAAAAAGVALLWEPRAARPKERAYSEEDIIAGV